MFERGVISITPSSDSQTQVSSLPGAGRHGVPVGHDWAKEGAVGINIRPANTLLRMNILFLVQ